MLSEFGVKEAGLEGSWGLRASEFNALELGKFSWLAIGFRSFWLVWAGLGLRALACMSRKFGSARVGGPILRAWLGIWGFRCRAWVIRRLEDLLEAAAVPLSHKLTDP